MEQLDGILTATGHDHPGEYSVYSLHVGRLHPWKGQHARCRFLDKGQPAEEKALRNSVLGLMRGGTGRSWDAASRKRTKTLSASYADLTAGSGNLHRTVGEN